MAVISSHILNSVDGTHCADIRTRLVGCKSGVILFDCKSDKGGRIKQTVEGSKLIDERYDLVFETGEYWAGQSVKGRAVIDPIVLRFSIDEPEGLYHMPIILSPHGYATWKSDDEATGS